MHLTRSPLTAITCTCTHRETRAVPNQAALPIITISAPLHSGDVTETLPRLQGDCAVSPPTYGDTLRTSYQRMQQSCVVQGVMVACGTSLPQDQSCEPSGGLAPQQRHLYSVASPNQLVKAERGGHCTCRPEPARRSISGPSNTSLANS